MKFLFLVVCGLCAAATLSAAAVYDASATFTGSRSVGSTGGLLEGGGSYGNLLLNWSIAEEADDLYTYTYTIAAGSSQTLSYILVGDFDAACTPSKSASCISNGAVDQTPAQVVSGDFLPGALSPGLEAGIAGIEFPALALDNPKELTISFQSPYAPVWGDFYLEGGGGYVGNSGNGNHIDGNSGDFVAVPGADGATPEPSTLLSTPGALVAAWLLRRRRRRVEGM